MHLTTVYLSYYVFKRILEINDQKMLQSNLISSRLRPCFSTRSRWIAPSGPSLSLCLKWGIEPEMDKWFGVLFAVSWTA